MKVCLLAAANSTHTVRWANGLVRRGVAVDVLSIHNPEPNSFDRNVVVHLMPRLASLGYASNWREVRRVLQKIKPDIVNAHYATGYGFLSRLANYRPTLLSVWGSDVYSFGEKSFLHNWFLRENLKAATAIASTSHAMARQTRKILATKPMFVTPFGIEESVFKPSPKAKDCLVIGTVKSLSKTYGIDLLLRAYALVLGEIAGEIPTKLEITGAGPDLHDLMALAAKLGIEKSVTFHGPVPHSQVPQMLNRLDIYVALSRADSFGVAILEAAACGKPVVVSDADGPKEVTLDGETGIVVPRNDPASASRAILTLIRDSELRERMSKAAREHAVSHYSWETSLDIMIESYKKTIAMA